MIDELADSVRDRNGNERIRACGNLFIQFINRIYYYICFSWPINFCSFYRYLMVECEDDGTPPTNNNPSKTSHKDMYSAVIRRLLTELRLMGPKGETMCTELAESVP